MSGQPQPLASHTAQSTHSELKAVVTGRGPVHVAAHSRQTLCVTQEQAGDGDATQDLVARYLPPVPWSEGATGASTAENTDSLASSMSCCENRPHLAQSTAFAKDWSVSVERGSLGDAKQRQSGLTSQPHIPVVTAFCFTA